VSPIPANSIRRQPSISAAIGEDRIGAGADIRHAMRTVAKPSDPSRTLAFKAEANFRVWPRPSHFDKASRPSEPDSASDRAPSEASRALLEAGDQVSAGIGIFHLRILGRLVAHAQARPGRARLLRRFTSRIPKPAPPRLAGARMDDAIGISQRRQTMSRQPIGAGVELRV